MIKKEAIQFKESIENICGEANEAARLSNGLFDGEDLKTVRRELARLMEIVEARILPVLRKKYKNEGG